MKALFVSFLVLVVLFVAGGTLFKIAVLFYGISTAFIQGLFGTGPVFTMIFTLAALSLLLFRVLFIRKKA